MDTSINQEKKLIRRKLEALKAKEYIPAPLRDVVCKVMERQLDARETCKVDLPAEGDIASEERHLLGAPLLDREAFGYDKEQYIILFREFFEYLRESGGMGDEVAETILKDIAEGELDLHEAAEKFLQDDETFFTEYAARIPQAPLALHFLVQAALAPSLQAVAMSVFHRHNNEAPWEHGSCPVCGGAPVVGRLVEKEGYRKLTCSFCRTEYRVKRVLCPYCCEGDSTKLLFFRSEDEPGWRVETCASCKAYIKTADFREMDRVSVPLLDDLESLALDVLADKEGYVRPTLSGFGF
jgi:FdhE protein